MNYIKILATGSYLPILEIKNEELEKEYQLEKGYIEKRTGIKRRFYSQNENISYMAIKAVNDLKTNYNFNTNEIDLIIVATTTPDQFMPGISNEIQKELNIEKCNCIDILAGCNGYITAFDIAAMYIQSGKIEKALIVGVDILSKYTDKKDISTKIILSDGAGATLIGKSKDKKIFELLQKFYVILSDKGFQLRQ